MRQAKRPEVGHTASALGGFKTALQLLGVIATNVPGRPMTRLNDEEAAAHPHGAGGGRVAVS